MRYIKTIKNCKRIESIDILKAVGIILMIMGHVGFGKRFDFYIHGFHMPLFFFISGYLFNTKRTLGETILRKLKTLIIPYLSFGILTLYYLSLSANKGQIVSFIKHFVFYNNTLPASGALWFLTAIFFGNIIFYSLLNKNGRKFMLAIIPICIAIEFYFKIHLPYSISPAIVALPFMCAGFGFKNYERKIDKVFNRFKLPFVVLLLLLSGFLIFKNSYVNLRTATLANPIIFYIAGIISIMGYFYLAKILENLQFAFGKILKNILVYIGKNSLVYMCINQIVIDFLHHGILDTKILVLFSTLLIIAIFAYCINSNRIMAAIFKGKF